MCGVVGLIAPFSSQEWKFNTLRRLLLNSQERGTDAAGIAFISPVSGKLTVLKDGVSAAKLVASKDFRNLYDVLPPIVIGHARSASKSWNRDPKSSGSPTVYENNHPFFSYETGLAIVHNGLVEDDPWRKTVGKPNGIIHPFEGGTDSELILRMVESIHIRNPEMPMMEVIDNAVFNIAGKYAVLMISEKYPDVMWAFRHGGPERPLAVSYLEKERAILLASTMDIIRESIEEDEYLFDFFVRSKLPDDVWLNVISDDNSVEFTSLGEEPWFDICTDSIDAAPDGYSYHRKLAEEKDKEKTEEVNGTPINKEGDDDEDILYDGRDLLTKCL